MAGWEVSVDGSADFDVLICGGGLSALLLTRQLQLEHPELSILMLDAAQPRPAETIQKAGESILEGASYHFRHTLELGDYLFKNQVPKFGLRFFFNGGESRFADRLEYGGVQWPPFATFQLDRGLLEEELRRLALAGGCTILPGHRVTDLALAEDGLHQVTALADGRPASYRGRWLIDATGRRRLLTSRLGLTAKSEHRVSASWWWVDGKVDVEQLVDDDEVGWRQRVGPPRWHSTVHLAGDGYWMWIIPLASGKTSIGIVSDGTIHPIAERGDYAGALEWCRTHEPQFAELIADRPPLEYRVLRDLSYGASQVFSEQRWACVGDAAVLADPLYGFGNDLICHASGVISMLIGLDRKDGLTSHAVAEANRFFLTMFEVIQSQYLGTYGTFGSSALYTQKLAWDSSMYFAVLQQTLMQNMYDDPGAVTAAADVLERLLPLNRAMQRVFVQSIERDGPLHSVRGMRTWAPRVTALADSSLDKCVAGRFGDFLRDRLCYLEGIAAVLFAEVVRLSPSVPAEQRSRLLAAETGINPYAASLDPGRWQADGLFDAGRPAPALDVPAQFDARLRTEAERRDFTPLHRAVLAAAEQAPDRPAITDLDCRLSLAELAGRGLEYADWIGQLDDGNLGIEPAGVLDGAAAVLGALAAGRHYVELDPAWTAQERAEVVERLGIVATCAGIGPGPVSGIADSPPATVLDAVRPDQPAFSTVRFSDYGLRVVPYSQVQLFRMTSWLARLLRVGADEYRRASCLWLGRAQLELLVPLLAGFEVLTEAAWRAGGSATDLPVGQGVEPAIVMGRPADLAALVASGWTAHGQRVFSVGEPLPRWLSHRLRSSALRVCDFGYASFSHEVWDPYLDRTEASR